MNAHIDPPANIPFLLRLGIALAEKMTGRRMLPARLLAWYPRAALGSGALEALVAHQDGRLGERMLKLVRMAASYAVECPFCVDMNSYNYAALGVTPAEVTALRGQLGLESVESFSPLERLAIQYARLVSQTPLKFHPDLIAQLKENFSEREIVILASTAAQVNYWARLIQALGVPPAGFMSE